MPKEKEKTKPVELECEEDKKKPGHLVCAPKEGEEIPLNPPFQKGEVLSSLPFKKGESERDFKEQPNIVIGAINIGTKPARDFLRNRWGQFYHEKRKWGSWHLAIDIILLAAVLFLAGLNVFLASGWRATSAPAIEFKLKSEAQDLPLGKQAIVTLSYFNSGKDVVKNAKFILKPSSGLKILSIKGGVWNAEDLTIEAGSVLPYDSEKLEIVVEGLAPGKQELAALFEFVDKKEKLWQESQHIVFSIPEIKLNFSAFARYFSAEGEQLGRGPLPPEVGETTKYQVFWVVEKPEYSLKNVRVEGILAENVSWTGFAPLGGEKLSFDPLTRKAVWRAGNVKAEDFGGSTGVIFEIGFKPDETQKGQIAPLITNLKAQSQEEKTGASLKAEAPDITTELIADKKAQEKGSSIK